MLWDGDTETAQTSLGKGMQPHGSTTHAGGVLVGNTGWVGDEVRVGKLLESPYLRNLWGNLSGHILPPLLPHCLTTECHQCASPGRVPLL